MKVEELVERLMPDSSAIINGSITAQLENVEAKDLEVIVPLAALEELHAQASKGKETGFVGLKELKRLRTLCEQKGIPLRFSGERPSLDDIKLAGSGRIDAKIIDIAKKEAGVLVTSDYVQALVADAEGVKVKYIPSKAVPEKLTFEKFFTSEMQSLHLKEDVYPLAKIGKPGKFELSKVGSKPLSAKEIDQIIKEIFEAARLGEGFFEINRNGAMVIQLGNYRVAVARPPFSDGLEVTIVRPLVKLTLEDYKLSRRLMLRLREKAEGILIAGPPGSGKTTFASSIAEFYLAQNKIVKTLESPRDLQVGPEVTQYGPLEGSFAKAAEILLLVRPDYTFFDELRKTEDFEVFADMRLAGVGMVGVVHASNPVDAIQRFIGRVELGIIPHIVDTLIFLRYGEIDKVYELRLTVKVPAGMTEEDLARPVIEIRDFETGMLEFEIYTFGNENVVIPMTEIEEKHTPTAKLAEEKILEEIRRFDASAEVELTSRGAIVRVDRKAIPRLIGKDGSNIIRLERKLGVRLDVQPSKSTVEKKVEYDFQETKGAVCLLFNQDLVGKTVNIYIEDNFIMQAIVGKKAQVKVDNRSSSGEELINALAERKPIKVTVTS